MPGFGNPFVIKQDGNVGIGTTAPSQKLHISGNMRLTGAFRDRLNSQGAANYVLTSTGSNGTQWVDASGSSIIGGPYLPLVGGTMSGNIVFNNNIAETWKDNAGATTRMMILNSANIAYIGPVDTYAGGPILYGTSADVTAQVFYTGASERMRVTDAGNVGIGTTSPGEKLDVAGTNVGIKINGTQSSRVYYNRSGTYTWSTGLRSGDT